MKLLRTLVIGTSLTDASDGVVRTGVALAQATGASPWLIHACSPLLIRFGGVVDARWTSVQVKGLRELLAGQVERTGLSALASFSPARVHVVTGSPHREIVDLARHARADLIVVGAAETPHGILGSTADRVIRKATCPVLAVRSEAAFPPTRVEIPVDLSSISANALRQGLDFLAELGVPLDETEALFVLNPLEVEGSIQFTPEQIQGFAHEELRRFLSANVLADLSPRAVQVRTGYAREEILARMVERQVDLAVLGTHGRGGFERLMVGSVATGVLQGAHCNLLVVPPTASQRHESVTDEKPADAECNYVLDEAPATSRS